MEYNKIVEDLVKPAVIKGNAEALALAELAADDARARTVMEEYKKLVAEAKRRVAKARRQADKKKTENKRDNEVAMKMTDDSDFADMWETISEAGRTENIVNNDGDLVLKLFSPHPESVSDDMEANRRHLEGLENALHSSAVLFKYNVCNYAGFLTRLRAKHCVAGNGGRMHFYDWMGKHGFNPKNLSPSTLDKYFLFANFIANYPRFLYIKVPYGQIMKWLAAIREHLQKSATRADFWRDVSDVKRFLMFKLEGLRSIPNDPDHGKIPALPAQDDVAAMDVDEMVASDRKLREPEPEDPLALEKQAEQDDRMDM